MQVYPSIYQPITSFHLKQLGHSQYTPNINNPPPIPPPPTNLQEPM
jgi:hypothetical protein